MRRHLHSHRLSAIATLSLLGALSLQLPAQALGLGGQGNLVGQLTAQPRQLQGDALGAGRGRLALDGDRLRRAERRALTPSAEGQGALTSSNALKSAAPAEGEALPRPVTLQSGQLLQGAGQLGAPRGDDAAAPLPAANPEPTESSEPAPTPAPAKPATLSGEGRAATQAGASGPRGRQTQVGADAAGQGSARPGQVQGNGSAGVKADSRR